MRNSGIVLIFTLALIGLTSAVAYGQFREDQNNSDYSGPVVKQYNSSEVGNWSNLFNMQMSHSYSMNFMSYGGQFRNINAYTNTMNFSFSERLKGRVDISLLHSPFGNSYLNNGNGGMGADIIIRNAELNYQLGEKSHISIQFHQNPYSSYRRGPFDRYGFSRY